MKYFIVVLALFLLPAAALAEQEISGAQSIEGNTGIVAPIDPAKVPVAPDLPLSGMPAEPVNVRFVVEHRSALHEKKITVRGTVVAALLGEQACPPDRGMCAQPRVTLSDTGQVSPDKLYDLVVLLPEGDAQTYTVGQSVELTGIVSASPSAVVMHRE